MKTAIFTVDNLLFDGDLREQFMRALVDNNRIDKKFLDDKLDIEEDFDDGVTTNAEKERQEAELYERYLKDFSQNDLVDFLRQNFALEKGIQPWARELITLLQDSGYVVVMNSLAPEFMLDELQEVIGTDTFFTGTRTMIQRSLKQAADQSESVLVLSKGDYDAEILALGDEILLYEPSAEYYERDEIAGKPFTIVNEDNLILTVRGLLN